MNDKTIPEAAPELTAQQEAGLVMLDIAEHGPAVIHLHDCAKLARIIKFAACESEPIGETPTPDAKLRVAVEALSTAIHNLHHAKARSLNTQYGKQRVDQVIDDLKDTYATLTENMGGV